MAGAELSPVRCWGDFTGGDAERPEPAGVSSYWQTLITGAIIVVSISVTAWSQHQNRSLL
ncbi:hypothetical protein IUJ34_09415 [Klebsiella pneumoniae subsp. pneumoniae]|uniref:Uncharacterized protein n=1 Tax=Klebsiella pneumoniae subsp. pneumoniae TaxID=72407 RepID=A0A7S9E1H2_KLEPN|nr:hypothetical protein IUJ34_09415 [Klebsiella pneumoniae subsp. pneumoniae]